MEGMEGPMMDERGNFYFCILAADAVDAGQTFFTFIEIKRKRNQ
jgi:hypothetical protein